MLNSPEPSNQVSDAMEKVIDFAFILVARYACADEARQLNELVASIRASQAKPEQQSDVALLHWFGRNRDLSLSYYSPVYCDDDDQSEEWRVTRESGSINDREWEVVGRGEIPFVAISAALAALDGETR